MNEDGMDYLHCIDNKPEERFVGFKATLLIFLCLIYNL